MFKRILCLMCVLILLIPSAHAAIFTCGHGDREQKRIALTMDDCFNMSQARAALDLCKQYGVTMTFFPLGDTLHEEDADFWQEVIDAGCEIGNHTNHHNSFCDMSDTILVATILRFQEKLDALLGYHYQVRSLRPPFGAYKDSDGSAQRIIRHVRLAGYEQIVLWDVESNDPKEALRKTQNGSILLYHARQADVTCLTELIPALLDEGYELVTVRELLDFEENTISDELFVYNRKDYFGW